MKKVSIMQAQHNLSQVLKQVEEGQAVYVTRRKQVVAKIVPPGPEQPLVFPDFAARAQKSWGGKWSGMSSAEALGLSRGDQ